MKVIKLTNIILIVLLVLLAAFDLLMVLPEYCACRAAPEGATVKTVWGYSLDCIGDTEEFSWVFFQLIGLIALTVLAIIIILSAIIHRQKRKNKTRS